MKPWTDIQVPEDRRVVALMHDDEASQIGLCHVILCETVEEAQMLVWLATSRTEGEA